VIFVILDEYKIIKITSFTKITVQTSKKITMILEEINIESSLFKLKETSRVWVYQSNKTLSEKEVIVLQSQLNAFVKDWTAHSQQLSAASDILFNRFVILAVDESQAGASGCSIDKSIHFLQSVENQYNITLFDRLTFAYFDKNEAQIVSSNELKQLYTEGAISDETLVFDNMVNTVAALKTSWLKPLGASWHKRFV
jgi:hypothetical protein